MAKSQFGEYSAFDTQGGVRFMKNSKLVSKTAVPPEVVAYLETHLAPEAEAPAPTPPVLDEETKARLRAESLQVAPELQATPEKLEQDAHLAEAAPPLSEADFDVPEPPRPVDPSPSELPPELGVVSTTEDFPEPPQPQVAQASEMSEFMESVSIHTASIEDISEALYERFGIYTIWLKRFPANDEINPLTGEGFTKYHLGIAYQAAVRAQNQGLFDLDPGASRRALDEGRAASANLQDQFDKQPVTLRENREANSFAYRTSPMSGRETPQFEIKHMLGEDGKMHAIQVPIQRAMVNGVETETGSKNGAGVGYKSDEDEPIVEPNFSGKPIIRPNW